MKNMFDVSSLEVSRFVNLSGDMLKVIKTIPDASIHSVVTDPPYGLAFMGKSWDHSVPGPEYWKECLRVLKPGGHLLSFGGTRMYHRMTCAIEDAGFEIRDCIMWLYGSGFPKSHNVSKAIDKLNGQSPTIVGVDQSRIGRLCNQQADYNTDSGWSAGNRSVNITKGTSPDAQAWDGWGTALKPAWEPIIMARKPLEATVAANVLKHGTGALNIEATRIAVSEGRPAGVLDPKDTNNNTFKGRIDGSLAGGSKAVEVKTQGRWPANVILDKKAGRALDAQTGNRPGAPHSAKGKGKNGPSKNVNVGGGEINCTYGDSGGASRFFYSAKASKSEKNAGLKDGLLNKHPTVKPISLMSYLCKLVTPENGIVLDPFAGSGSTGCGAVQEGFRYIGIDLNDDPDVPCTEIANHRIQHWLDLTKAKQADTLTDWEE